MKLTEDQTTIMIQAAFFLGQKVYEAFAIYLNGQGFETPTYEEIEGEVNRLKAALITI